MSPAEIHAAARNLPTLPVVYATSVLNAPSKLSREADSAVRAHADFFRQVDGTDEPQEIMVRVLSPGGALLGHVTYTR